MFILVWSDSSL